MIITQGLGNGLLVTQGYGSGEVVEIDIASIRLGGKPMFHYPRVGLTQ